MKRTGKRGDRPRGQAAERAAWIFYGIAAFGSMIGQVWVGVETPPWPHGLDWWWRAPFVAPFAAVIDLGGVVTSAFADWRQRLGEAAYGWWILSAASVTVGVAINIIGHHNVPYLAVVFGGLGAWAYAVWLMHSAARRRDALRAAGKLADTAPVYGIVQWWREPTVTRRARSLALTHGYPLHESLDLARQQLRDEQRQAAVELREKEARAALAMHVEALIRSQHDDPVRASIAATTLDIGAVAAALRAQADVAGWARVIGADLLPPPLPDGVADSEPDHTQASSLALAGALLPANLLRRIPQDQASYDRWRQMWAELKADPTIEPGEFSDRHGISVRQVQWIRRVGMHGLLDSPLTLLDRIAQLPAPNGQQRHQPATTS
jgi:hypothetical protein